MSNVIENILTRRSIRKYTDQQISDEDLKIILEAAKYAPSGGNSQTWHFMVLQNKEKLLQLNGYIKSAFEKLEVDESTYRSIRTGKEASKNDSYNFYYHAPTLIIVSNEADYGNAMADSACAIENMFLVSHYLQIGSCWINQVSWFCNDKSVRTFLTELGVPENHKVCGSICLGYRDGNAPVAKERKENIVTIIK
ncbi:nitroreductase [Sporomusaceae bacterium BoRhaA]|uniref:nitroreductase family protein n=1 Tax=Pelorhabdus rhamnosifermentans TaxID=2772457 RepID=UPI001C062F50|nr:nitroreductase family protein [Pelorhabdus rhamnosifermentans]MBU2699634.1 nitroreductase [Pelorhabdus rhamnosifermentans]